MNRLEQAGAGELRQAARIGFHRQIDDRRQRTRW
jgi:hypothetical protein